MKNEAFLPSNEGDGKRIFGTCPLLQVKNTIICALHVQVARINFGETKLDRHLRDKSASLE